MGMVKRKINGGILYYERIKNKKRKRYSRFHRSGVEKIKLQKKERIPATAPRPLSIEGYA
jgi:hypothetical protein